MLKVECESCKAPYQIDERRVPAAGLKMRCPKCGHSFVVKNPAAAGGPAPTVAPAKPPGPPPPPRVVARPTTPTAPSVPVAAKPPAPTPPRSGTAVFGAADIDLPALAGGLPSPVAPAAPAVTVKPPSIQKRTMMGVAGPANSPGGPRVVRAASPAMAAPPPAAGKPSFDLGFEAPDFADLPSPVADLPSPARVPTAKAGIRVAPKQTMAFGTDAFGEADLPSPAHADLPSPAHADLPSPANIGLPAAATVGLPAAAHVGLPATAKVGYPSPAKQPAGPRGRTVAFGEIDLPSAAQDLPAVASSLPAVANALPAVANALPAVANALPSVAQSLPSVAQSLPQVAQSLPVAMSGGDDFGELELPRAPGDGGKPPPLPRGRASVDSPTAPRAAAPVTSLFDENPFSSVAPPKTADAGPDAGFGELELPVPPAERGGSVDRMPASERGSVGGMAFGELDLGGGATPSQIPGGVGADNPFGEASLGSVIQPPPNAPHGVELSRVSAFGNLEGEARSSGAEGYGAPADASIDTGPRVRRDRAPVVSRAPVPWLKILGGILAVLIVGGVATMFTRLGPFGYYYVFDAMHAAEYTRLATNAVQSMHDAFASERFADAQGVADKLAAQRAARPRARSLTAVAAIAELETELRFGKDPDRANRAKIWLTTEIPEPRSPDKVKYLDVALAAASAVDREKDKARSGFDAAARKYGSDPIQQDIAFLRGELELRSGDGVAAAAAFKKALELAPGARAHFGLARAAYLAGDLKTAWTELGATIAASPKHGAALLLRAEIAWAQGRDDAAARTALQDIATLLDGPARASISTTDQAEAFAERGVIQFARGRMGEARKAFEDALKVDQRNVSALIGQGDLLYDEGRTTEALSRYETAKQVDPNSVPAIVGDAKTQIQLERLADAKTQLAAAAQKFPKSPLARQWYATAEAALGDKKSAEKDYLAAIDLVDPKDPDAITPYAAYASFLDAQGRSDEAKAKLAEAQQKLPDSIALERTLGDVGITQGSFVDAVAHFRAALAMDGEDVSSRFKLGRALRLANQLEEAAKVFDAVYEADKNFPGLSLERGQLFEQSGDVQKALEQFKTALDAHPNDPDLMLRVGASYVAIGQGEKAEPLLREVLKQRPNSAEAEHYLGRALMIQGPLHHQEAMRHLQTAVNRDGNRAEFHLYVGWLANMLVSPDLNLAKREVDRALELDQTLGDAYWQKGVYESYGGQVESALKDLQHALQLKPTRFEAHATLAEVYDQKNMPDAAIAEWRLALAHKEDDETWNFKLGLLLGDHGSPSEAAARLKAATEAGEQDQPRPMWLQRAEYPCAEALQRVGDAKGACDHYTKFLEQADQNNPDRRDAIHKCAAVCGHSCVGP